MTSMSPSSVLARWMVPKGVGPEALPLLMARALRAIGDGYMAVLLPANAFGQRPARKEATR